jgi:hypothetical protein
MARYAIKINPPYTQEGSTGKLIMNIPRLAEYSIVDTVDGDRVILDVKDHIPDPLEMAKLICRKLNS